MERLEDLGPLQQDLEVYHNPVSVHQVQAFFQDPVWDLVRSLLREDNRVRMEALLTTEPSFETARLQGEVRAVRAMIDKTLFLRAMKLTPKGAGKTTR